MCKMLDVCGNDCPGKAKENSPPVYQLHLTVINVANEELFRKSCETIGMKPLMIVNQTSDGREYKEFITSKTLPSLMEVMLSLMDASFEFGKHVIRQKIETVYWNPIIERHTSNPLGSWYFETHWKVDGLFSTDWLKGHNLALSRNGTTTYITNRNKFPLAEHKKLVDIYRKLLQDYVVIDEERTEFVMSDTNPELDRNWLESWK